MSREQRELDARVVAHLKHMGELARTVSDSVITSFRERAPNARQAQRLQEDMALDPTRELPGATEAAFEPQREPAGNEVFYLAHLLRTYPTPESYREGGA